jgi:hypothetical protein
MEIMCYVKENLEKFEQNSASHYYNTRQRKRLYIKYCRTEGCKNSVNNIGKRLYNKLPNNLKSIDDTLHFRRKLNLFLLQQTLCSVEEYFMHKIRDIIK